MRIPVAMSPPAATAGCSHSTTAGPYVTFVPTRRHTWTSDVRISALPSDVDGLVRKNGVFTPVRVTVKDSRGRLTESAVPKVIMIKGDLWLDDDGPPAPASELGIAASIDMLQGYPLAGIVAEGLAPYAGLSPAQDQALTRAVYRGLPVVRTARGNATGLVRPTPGNLFIEGNNLTATKARLLLTAAIMKLGVPPHAADPDAPHAGGARGDQEEESRHSRRSSRLTEPPVTPKPLPAHEVHERPAASGRRVRAGRGRG